MKIYIDFDRTIFDCEAFLRDLYAIIKKYQIPKDIFMKCQNQCKKQGFNPLIILKKVEQEYQFDANIYDEINDLLKKSNSYLYDDAIQFLEYLKHLDYQIIILTKGNTDYQKMKITYSNIQDYYDGLMVTMKHKGHLDIDYKNSVFVDDNPMEIESIRRKKPKAIIRIKRENSKYFDIAVENVETVNSLAELSKKNIL